MQRLRPANSKIDPFMAAINRNSLVWPTLFATAGLGILIGLGTWQLQRLNWKNDLVATIEARVDAEPLPLQQVLLRAESGDDIRYMRVRAEGAFEPEKEIHLYTVIDGRAGWLVYAPFAVGDRVLVVNRGFVPEENRDRGTRSPIPAEPLEITGLVRLSEAQTMFVPDNEPERNNWFWRDLDGMAAAFGQSADDIYPFFVDLQLPGPEDDLPRPGTTRIKLSNRHLSYAITWFGLAAGLAGIYLAFVITQKKREPE